jgi:hypothetical protein
VTSDLQPGQSFTNDDAARFARKVAALGAGDETTTATPLTAAAKLAEIEEACAAYYGTSYTEYFADIRAEHAAALSASQSERERPAPTTPVTDVERQRVRRDYAQAIKKANAATHYPVYLTEEDVLTCRDCGQDEAKFGDWPCRSLIAEAEGGACQQRIAQLEADLQREREALADIAEDFVSVDLAHDDPLRAVTIMGQMIREGRDIAAERERESARLRENWEVTITELASLRNRMESRVRELLDEMRVVRDDAARRGEAVTRTEVIDYRADMPTAGRAFSAYNVTVEQSYQDDGLTLKLFVNDRAALSSTQERQ